MFTWIVELFQWFSQKLKALFGAGNSSSSATVNVNHGHCHDSDCDHPSHQKNATAATKTEPKTGVMKNSVDNTKKDPSPVALPRDVAVKPPSKKPTQKRSQKTTPKTTKAATKTAPTNTTAVNAAPAPKKPRGRRKKPTTAQ